MEPSCRLAAIEPEFIRISGTVPVAITYSRKESVMSAQPKRQEPEIPPKKPDIQPEPRPEEIPQNKDVPERQSPPMRV